MTPETKKTLIYGGVISFAVGVALYIWTQHENASQPANATPDQAAQAAQLAAQQAAQQETQLAELSALSSSGQIAPVSIGSEAPPDDFSQEIAAILNATGFGASSSTTATTAAPASSTPAPSAGETPPANAPKAVGPIKVVPKSNLITQYKVAQTGDNY